MSSEPARRVGAASGPPEELPRVIGLWDAAAIVVGLIIGSGIFRAPATVAGHLPAASLMFAAWVIGGKGDRSFLPTLEKMALEDKSPEVRELAEIAAKKLRGEEVAGYETWFRRFFWDDLWEVGWSSAGAGDDRKR